MKLSVVIPAYNEASVIVQAVASAKGIGDEVIVVDASSPDGTADLARANGAIVIDAPKGRGAQLAAGADSASGDVLLFLHADTRLPSDARRAIERALADPRVVGGNFYLRFDSETAMARFYTWANHVRRRLLRVYYGDSALFVRREVYLRIGGFPSIPIMEDYELVRRLERHGPTSYVRDVTVTTSARRFERAPLRTLLVWAVVHGLYCAGVPAERLVPLYRDLRGAA